MQAQSNKDRAVELMQERDIVGNYADKYRKGKANFDFDTEADNAVVDLLGHEPDTEEEESRRR